MISVALTTYNSSKYIKKQLYSILNQSVSVNEVIIVDDFSTDDTLKIINEFINDNGLERSWKIYTHNENKGYIISFYDAINFSNGEYIVLCDHDDEWLDNKVEIIKDTLDRNDEILMLATSFIQIDESDNEVYIKKNLTKSNNNLIRRRIKRKKLNRMNFKDISVYNISPGCTCALRKELKLEFIKKHYDLPHDWTLCTMAAIKGGLYYLDVPTTKYRLYNGNTIGLGHINAYEERKRLVKKGLCEKNEIINLIKNSDSFDDKNLRIEIKVRKIFEERVNILTHKKILCGIKLIFTSFGYCRLYESVLYDIYSIIKYKISERKMKCLL